MAIFVIAGKAGCPAFARAEMLAETLVARLPHFKLNKLLHSEEDWPSWVTSECNLRGWSHAGSSSPIVWRELVDTGSKGLYLGGLKEFEEYSLDHYDIQPPTNHELEMVIASENLAAFQQQQLEIQSRLHTEPVKVFVSNANSPLAYHLVHRIATGDLLGDNQHVAIHLYHHNTTTSIKLCQGLSMELQDLASPLLDYVRVTTSLKEALDSVNIVFLLDYSYTPNNIKKYHSPENSQERRDEIGRVVKLYNKYAHILDFAASKDVKVIVNGCFANTGAAIMAISVSSIPSSSFIATPSLVESQSRALLANRLHLNASDITQVVVWGRTHGSVLVDISRTRVAHHPGAIVGPDPFTRHLSHCEFGEEWLTKSFIDSLSSRHSMLSDYREDGPCVAEAASLVNLGQSWIIGDEGEWHSVGVVSDGNMYQVPKDVVFCFPCQYKEGKWEVVLDLDRSQYIQDQLVHQVDYLKSELDIAIQELNSK